MGRWVMVPREEEILILQQFLRFQSTRSLSFSLMRDEFPIIPPIPTSLAANNHQLSSLFANPLFGGSSGSSPFGLNNGSLLTANNNNNNNNSHKNNNNNINSICNSKNNSILHSNGSNNSSNNGSSNHRASVSPSKSPHHNGGILSPPNGIPSYLMSAAGALGIPTGLFNHPNQSGGGNSGGHSNTNNGNGGSRDSDSHPVSTPSGTHN